MAEESLLAAQRLTVGTGAASVEDRREMIAEWERVAALTRVRPRAKATPDTLAAMGIGVRGSRHGG